MDNLEQLISENRDKFDKYRPRRSIWLRIRKETGLIYPRLRWWNAIAAAAVILTGVTVLFQITVRRDTFSRKMKKSELNEAVFFYSTRFNNLYQSAGQILANQPGLKNELNTDMALLDSIMVGIQQDLKDNISNAEVIEALIQNYRTRVWILEEMISILKENQIKDEKNDKNNL
ncbi:MAG: hypothetical protein ACUVTX_11675 [Bacteroidales bacterium]